jgi:hypothetical protein
MYVAHVLRPGICRKLAEHFGRMQSSTGFLPIAANQLLARFNHSGAVKGKKSSNKICEACCSQGTLHSCD